MTTDQNDPSTTWQEIAHDYTQAYVEFVDTWGWVIWSLTALWAAIAALAAHHLGVPPGTFATRVAVAAAAISCIVSVYYASTHLRGDK